MPEGSAPIDRHRLEMLAGGAVRAPDQFDSYFQQAASDVPSLDSVSHEELNRLLVAAGFNRVGDGFFDYFMSLAQATPGGSDLFDERLAEWRKRLMLRFGNFRYPFRLLSKSPPAAIAEELRVPALDLSDRPEFGSTIRRIPERDTPLLGYIAGGLATALQAQAEESSDLEPDDLDYLERFADAQTLGEHNLYEYCTSEHMDVYVATSMRESEDFYAVSRFIGGVFRSAEAGSLAGVAYFDPTQASHDRRIIKGLVEGLMLKRSFCTIYLAQETDTLGKDSELATTLVQGKPVIAYVPRIGDVEEAMDQLQADLQSAGRDDPVARDEAWPEWKRLTHRFRSILPQEWADTDFVRSGIDTASAFEEALETFANGLKTLYDKRAKTLRQQHPLGVQVVLHTGVPNGVLVVRSPDECRGLLTDVLAGNLEFDIEAVGADGQLEADFDGALEADRLLRERKTRCVYRVAVGESPVANAFWNFYPDSQGQGLVTGPA